MSRKTKIVTGREIWEAIKLDGFGSALRDNWFSGTGENLQACLLGTAAINLGITATGEHSDNEEEYISLEEQLDTILIRPNHKWHPDRNGYGVRSMGLGSVIISNYDAQISEQDFREDENIINTWVSIIKNENPILSAYDNDELRDMFENEFDNYIETSVSKNMEKADTWGNYYKLTWDQSVEMARELLEPYFDREFEVTVEDYEEMYNWTPPTI